MCASYMGDFKDLMTVPGPTIKQHAMQIEKHAQQICMWR